MGNHKAMCSTMVYPAAVAASTVVGIVNAVFTVGFGTNTIIFITGMATLDRDVYEAARVDGATRVTGAAEYMTDVRLPGMLHAKFLRSPHAHARVVAIDTRKAEALPGVKAIVTSAALVVVVVAGSFVFADIVLIKALGLGVAIAVALDATVVRALLVPATMRLFGHLNWWAPPWLRPTRPRRVQPAE